MRWTAHIEHQDGNVALYVSNENGYLTLTDSPAPTVKLNQDPAVMALIAAPELIPEIIDALRAALVALESR